MINTNELVNGQAYHTARRGQRKVVWTTTGLKITRLRLISDPGFPFWDVSYCDGVMSDGELVAVLLPFDQLPKHTMRATLYKEAKATGKYIVGLFDNISQTC